MKALSIKQPWASLIVSGIKDIENRTWPTKYRGRIYVHASGKYAIPSKVSNLEFFGKERFELIQKIELFGLLYYRSYHPMSIIGEVDIVDCVIDHPSVWADQSWYANNMSEAPPEEHDTDFIVYNWVLANPVQYDEPIMNVKGKLSFWEWEGLK